MSDYNSMNARQREDLDRYITGNYGEDQFRKSDTWEELYERLYVLFRREIEQDLIDEGWRPPA